MGKLKKVWEWISHGDTIWGILRMIFPSSGGVIGGVISWLTNVHPLIWYFAILSGFALGLFISNELAAKRITKRQAKQRASLAIFYEDRDALARGEGTLKEQIEKTEHVWMSCFTGSTFDQSPALATHKIAKLILYDPRYKLLKVYAVMEGDVNKVKAYQTNILSATDEALTNNIPVYWVSRPLINLLIANEKASRKDIGRWAKIETFIPYRKAGERPSHIISEKEYPNLYEHLVESFSAILTAGETTIKVDKEILTQVKSSLGLTEFST